jgi:hypothetical protein
MAKWRVKNSTHKIYNILDGNILQLANGFLNKDINMTKLNHFYSSDLVEVLNVYKNVELFYPVFKNISDNNLIEVFNIYDIGFIYKAYKESLLSKDFIIKCLDRHTKTITTSDYYWLNRFSDVFIEFEMQDLLRIRIIESDDNREIDLDDLERSIDELVEISDTFGIDLDDMINERQDIVKSNEIYTFDDEDRSPFKSDEKFVDEGKVDYKTEFLSIINHLS